MNKSRSRILAASGLILMTVATLTILSLHFNRFEGFKAGRKPALAEKKVTILPIVVIGGLRFYRKAFEKK